jgi:hypothetical protein
MASPSIERKNALNPDLSAPRSGFPSSSKGRIHNFIGGREALLSCSIEHAPSNLCRLKKSIKLRFP